MTFYSGYVRMYVQGTERTKVAVWIALTFSAIAQSRHSDGVLNSSMYCKIIRCYTRWQYFVATVHFIGSIAEIVVGYLEL